MKVIGKILKLLLCIVLVLVLLLGLALGVFTAAEYRPAETEALIPAHETDAVLETGSPLSIVSWNCGYGALGDNADFFMDGGTSVYTADRQRVEANLADIRDRLKSLKPDFLLLQELSEEDFPIVFQRIMAAWQDGEHHEGIRIEHLAEFVSYEKENYDK